MSKVDRDGGLGYAACYDIGNEDEGPGGMSLRDYAEIKILSGLCAGMSPSEMKKIAEGIQGGRYYISASKALADVFLKAREVQS